MADDDQASIQAVLAGDKEKFEGLVHKYQHLVFALSLAQLRNAAAAEEVTQEVFIRAYQKLPLLRNPCRFSPWLCAIARNQCRMWRRFAQRRRRQVPLPASAGAKHLPAEEGSVPDG